MDTDGPPAIVKQAVGAHHLTTHECIHNLPLSIIIAHSLQVILHMCVRSQTRMIREPATLPESPLSQIGVRALYDLARSISVQLDEHQLASFYLN